MLDNNNNLENKNNEMSDGFKNFLDSMLDVLYKVMKEPIKKDVAKITDEKLKDTCEKFIKVSEEIINLFENEPELENYSKEDRKSFVSAIDLFCMKNKDCCKKIMLKEIENKLFKGEE